jgi:hypothetical protein
MKCFLRCLLFIIVCGCSHADIEKEKQRLLATYKEDRRAHILGDFVYIQNNRVDSFLSVHDGAIYKFNRQQTKDSMQRFFKRAQYDNWDDVEQPVINVSEDGSMAWLIYKIYVRRSEQNKQGSITQEEFIRAGINTYVKSDGRWMKTADVSTTIDGNK